MQRQRRLHAAGLAGDAAAPGIGRLAGRGVHQDERIERDLQAPPLQLGDRLQHPRVGWRAAIGRRPVLQRDQMRTRALHARHAPGDRQGVLGRLLDARPDLTLAAAQVGPEPGDHQGDVIDVRQLRLQLVQRHDEIGAAVGVVDALAGRAGQAVAAQHGLGRVDELAGARDQANALQPRLPARRIVRRARTAEDLERQLGRAVSERLQRQILEDDIGHAAIGRRLAFDRGDQRVGRLVLGPEVRAHRHARQVHHPPVGPDPADPVDRSLGHGDGERQAVGVGRRLLALGAADAPLDPLLAKARGPDHLAADPRAAEHARQRRALGGAGQAQLGDARTDLTRRRPGRQRGLVDHRAQRRSRDSPQRPADRRADAG